MIITATTKRIFISNKNAFQWDVYHPQQWPSLPGGRCLLPGVVSQQTPPPCGQTHACKNITFATLLRTVTRMHSSRVRTARSLPYGGGCQGNPLPLWTEWQTKCKNITFPQTSFAGGNKLEKWRKGKWFPVAGIMVTIKFYLIHCLLLLSRSSEM